MTESNGKKKKRTKEEMNLTLNSRATRGVKPRDDHPAYAGTIDGLNSMQSTFVREYLISNNAKDAAKKAGYKNTQSANNLLNMPKIADAIREARRDRAERLEITADKVLQEIASVAFANIVDVVEWKNGGIIIKDSRELSRLVTAAVAEVSETVTGKSTTTRVKMHDKMNALEKLMKHLGLYVRDTEENRGVDPLEMLKQAIEHSQKLTKEKAKQAVREDEEDNEDDEE